MRHNPKSKSTLYLGNHCVDVLYYYHSDHIGSSTFLTDAIGKPYQFMLYLPFGEAMAQQKVAGWSTPYTFTGKEQDVATGLHYYSLSRPQDGSARYYDTRLSMWFGVDPLAEMRPGHTPYNYVQNNPIIRIDPDGALDTDFLNSETGEAIHVEDGMDQIAVVNDEQFKQIQTLSSATSWNQTQTQQYESILNSSEIHTMDSDLGILSRLTYAEMAQGNDNAKAIVAESAINRTKRPIGSYENPDGTLTRAINKKGAYDVTSSTCIRNDEFLSPRNAIEIVKYKNRNGQTVSKTRPSYNESTWLSSISASYNALKGSNVGKGTIFYHSGSSTFRDNSPGYIKVNLNINHKGILGTWKLR